jgi:uncharacterized membrane-anchored protein
LLQREIVLDRGTLYKFRTAPIDPYDPFRGRYVWLNFEGSTSVPYVGDGDPPHNRYVYATIEVGEDGFAEFSGADVRPPASGDYLRAYAMYWQHQDRLLDLRLPFDRYYMNAAAAPEAERVVREHSTVTNRNAHVTVRVLNGRAVLEQLYVADIPIEEFLRQQDNAP